MNVIKSRIVCLLLAAAMLLTMAPMCINADVVQAAAEDDYILSSELDTIFDLYKDVAAYSVPEYTGNYKATEFADTMVDLYPFNYLYCKFVNDRSNFHGLLYTIDEAKDAFGSDNEDVLAAEAAGRSYYAPAKDNSFRYEENVTDSSGVAKDAWFTDAYYRADKKASAQGGMAFGIIDGSKISENDSEVSFVFEYLDNDTGTIKLQYINTDWTGGGYSGNDCTISKTGTGLWKTAVIPVNNAKLCPESNTKSTALCSGREDFLLKGNNMYISRIMVVKNSDIKPISADHEPISCPKTEIVDSQSGRTYYFMQADSKNAISTYVTSQCWNADGTKFIVGTTENKLYEYDTVNETLKFLDYATVGGSINAFVTPDNHIYYIYNRCVYRINWDTYVREVVCFLPSNCNRISNMHVTSDGKYISGYYYGSAGNGSVVRLNTQTGTLDAIYKKNFSVDNENSQGVGHPIINPVYQDIIFFCNEGTTTLIPDRLWMLDVSTGKMENIFKQSYNDDGTTAECSGHEVWNKDGEYLYFVKYTNNQQKGQNGVVRIPFKDGKFSGEREYINGDAAYWHCYPSGDNNWVAADTNGYNIYLMSTKTHESMLLADFDKLDSSFKNDDGGSTGSNHPYQPHPHISYNNKSVSWQMVSDTMNRDSLGIGWMDISDITGDTDYTKNEYTTGSFGKAVSYANTKSESTTEVVDGTTFVKAQNGNSVYFDIDDSFIKTVHQQLRLTFTTYSPDATTINVGYTSAVHNDYDWHKYEDKCVSLDVAQGTNTYSVDLGYVNANNICKYATDLYFTAHSGTTYVSNIIIEPYSDDNEFDTYESDMIYSFAGDDLDYCSGLQALSDSVDSSYTSGLFHVDDTAALSYGITSEQITTVKGEGFSYIANGVDGAWAYRTVTDSDGVTKNAWFTTRNKRVNTTSTHLDIEGQIYFGLTDDTITADDNELIVTVEYLDNRSTEFTMLYLNNTTDKTNTITFSPTNTGKWKTETHIITDAMLSSANSGTGLAKGYEDFRFQAAKSDLYVSKVIIQKPNKQYVSCITYTNDGSNSSSAPQTGNVAVTASVTNKTSQSSTVNVYAAVFDKFGDLMRVVKTEDTALAALESKDIAAGAVKVDSEETLKVFVWDDEMYPYELPEEKLNFKVSVSGSAATLSWDKYNNSSDYTYEVYCDGELLDTVDTNSYSHTAVSSGKHTWHIEVTDFYGKYIYRSANAVA